MTSTRIRSGAMVMLLGLGCQAQANHILPPILPGDIAINLRPIATGMAAPDYAISPPGDTSRLFVVEQNGLLRIIQNGSLLGSPRARHPEPGSRRRSIPPMPTTSAASSAWRFIPASTTPASPGLPHALHVHERADSGRRRADLRRARTARCRTTRTS